MKTCCRCKQTKPLSCFTKLAKAPDGLQHRCRDCNKAVGNPRVAKNNKLMRAYGITLEQYDYWNSVYGCVCHICGNVCPSKRSLAVDHDNKHELRLVRGLLCINCNKGLGNFKDNPTLLTKAIEYLNLSIEVRNEVINALDQIPQ